MAIKAQNQVTILDITDSYSVILSNENQTFPEVGYNIGTAQINSSTMVRAYRGSEEMWVWLASAVEATDSSDNTLKLTINKSATKSTKGLNLSITTNKAGWKQSGTLTLPILIFDKEITNPTTSSEGYLVTINKDFSYSVASYGDTGAAPTIYEIDASSLLFNYDSATSSFVNPTTITLFANSITGTTVTKSESGILRITPYQADGTAGSVSLVNLATATSHQYSLSPNSTYLYYVVELNIGGTINGSTISGGSFVDKQTISTCIQGADGENAYAIDITSLNGFIFKNTAINTTLIAHVYCGGQEFDNDDYDDTSGHYGFGTQDAPLYINWYKDNVGVATGVDYTITSQSVQSLATITAKLEDTKWSANN